MFIIIDISSRQLTGHNCIIKKQQVRKNSPKPLLNQWLKFVQFDGYY